MNDNTKTTVTKVVTTKLETNIDKSKLRTTLHSNPSTIIKPFTHIQVRRAVGGFWTINIPISSLPDLRDAITEHLLAIEEVQNGVG